MFAKFVGIVNKKGGIQLLGAGLGLLRQIQRFGSFAIFQLATPIDDRRPEPPSEPPFSAKQHYKSQSLHRQAILPIPQPT